MKVSTLINMKVVPTLPVGPTMPVVLTLPVVPSLPVIPTIPVVQLVDRVTDSGFRCSGFDPRASFFYYRKTFPVSGGWDISYLTCCIN